MRGGVQRLDLAELDVEGKGLGRGLEADEAGSLVKLGVALTVEAHGADRFGVRVAEAQEDVVGGLARGRFDGGTNQALGKV